LLSVKKNAVREKSVHKPSRVSHKNDFRRAPFSKAESFQESLSTSLDAINKSNEREMLTNQKLLYPRFAWLTLSLGMGCTCLAGHAPLQRVDRNAILVTERFMARTSHIKKYDADHAVRLSRANFWDYFDSQARALLRVSGKKALKRICSGKAGSNLAWTELSLLSTLVRGK
jgi:hypothetical protein